MKQKSKDPQKKDRPAPPAWLATLERGMQRANQHIKTTSPLSRRTHDASKPHYASFNDRVFAVSIDVGILSITVAPLFTWLFGMFFPNQSRINPPNVSAGQMIMWFFENIPATLVIHYIVLYIILGGIYLWCWNKSAATPGKWLLRMRIVDAQTFRKPTSKQLFYRYLGYLISVPPLTIGCMWAMLSRRQRTWHDMIAGTVVVKVKHWRWHDDGITPHAPTK